ncbi:MAG: hypothetical protein WAZ40_00565 [Minisyncoccia bacterium]
MKNKKIHIVLGTGAGVTRLPERNQRGHAKKADTAIVVMADATGLVSRGIAIIYHNRMNTTHFAGETSIDPKVFWRGLYIANKMIYVSDEAIELALLLAKETALEGDVLKKIDNYLPQGHSGLSVQTEAFVQKIPSSDIKKIVDGFKLFRAPLETTDGTALEKAGRALGMFREVIGSEKKSVLALV